MCVASVKGDLKAYLFSGGVVRWWRVYGGLWSVFVAGEEEVREEHTDWWFEWTYGFFLFIIVKLIINNLVNFVFTNFCNITLLKNEYTND